MISLLTLLVVARGEAGSTGGCAAAWYVRLVIFLRPDPTGTPPAHTWLQLFVDLGWLPFSPFHVHGSFTLPHPLHPPRLSRGPVSRVLRTRCDPTKPVPVRVDSLLGLLTLGEKIAQLQTTHSGKLLPGESNRSIPHGYVERLGLETYTVTECLHGVCRANSTVFPQSISLAATFNSALLHAVGEAIGVEARGWRNDFEATQQYPNRTALPPGLACFSPQINIARVSELTDRRPPRLARGQLSASSVPSRLPSPRGMPGRPGSSSPSLY